MSKKGNLSDKQMKSLLQLPSQRKETIRVVMDTDFNNEADDFFALTWLLMPNDKIKVEGIYAAPFSFRQRLGTLLQANELIKADPDNLTKKEKNLVASQQGQIAAIEALGIKPESLAEPGQHVALYPNEGMETSYEKLREFTKLFKDFDIPILKGAAHYIENGCPVRSEAVSHMISLARSASTEDPIYVLGLAASTNLASALMIAPDIKDKVVFVWTAGYPTNVTSLKNDSFNLEQDIVASQILFSSGVPLVYIPGFYIGQQLTLSEADMKAWFRDSGPIGKALYHRYMDNPLYSFYGIDKNNLFGRVWTIWDVITVAWLLHPDAVPSHLVPSVRLTRNGYWRSQADSHLIRECYGANYNGIFPALTEQLRAYESDGG